MSNPFWFKRFGGTIRLSSIGMFGPGGGWGIPIAPPTLMITIGGITTKPRYLDGSLEPREMVDLKSRSITTSSTAPLPPDSPDDSPSWWSRQTASRRAEERSRSLVSQGPGEVTPPFPGAVEFSLQQRTFNIVHIKTLSARHRVIPVAVGNLRRPLRG